MKKNTLGTGQSRSNRTGKTSAVVALVLLLNACFVSGAQGPSEDQPSATATQSSFFSTYPTMASGADVVRGVLSQTCSKGSCRTIPQAAPRGRLTVSSQTPTITFALGEKPSSAQAILRVDDKPRLSDIEPGTVMVWEPKIPMGLHVVRFKATFGDEQKTWTFAIERVQN